MVRSLVLELLGSVRSQVQDKRMYVYVSGAICKWKKYYWICNFLGSGDQPPDLHLEMKGTITEAGHLPGDQTRSPSE